MVAAFILGFFLISAAGCTSRQPAGSRAGEEKPVVVRLAGGDWGYPSPYAHCERGPGYYKMLLIFDSLLEKDEGGIIPWLAAKWEVSGERVYTFHLRKNVRWQDGKPFTAGDVVFSWEYARKHPRAWGIDPALVDEVRSLDEHTVRFRLTRPNAAFLYKLAGFPILPAHIWKDVADPYHYTEPRAVVGTGPYRLASYSKEEGAYRFEANRDFWGPKPRVDVIEMVPVEDEALALEQGKIDLAAVPPDLIERFQNKPGCHIAKGPGYWGYRLIFNLNLRPVLRSREFRQVLAFAIDRKELVEKCAQGAALPGNPGILPPDHIWYNPNVPQYRYNLRKAVELLEQLGWYDRDGDGIREDARGNRLAFELLLAQGDARLGKLLKQQLRKAGIELKITSTDPKSRDSLVKQGKYELAVTGEGGWGNDPDYLRERFTRSAKGAGPPVAGGTQGYCNPTVERLAKEQLHETNPVKRRNLVAKLQKALAEDLPELPLYYPTPYYIYRASVYAGWTFMFDHHSLSDAKLSYLASS
ncbi:MAG: diguanylate phosphodiesterase [Firmicutes bacterium]|nr:diguanylate phosphodiesterase [Bacillota bacterium]